MDLALFLLAAGSISLSGVLAPGPITAVTAARGAESPHAGVWVTVGHTLVEIAVMAALFLGARQLSESLSPQGGDRPRGRGRPALHGSEHAAGAAARAGQ